MCHYSSPKEQSKECRRHNDSFDKEEDPELLDRHTSQYRLKDPVDEEAEQACRCDTSICRKVVREPFETWPYGFDATLQEASGLYTQNGRPHGGDEGSDDDRKVRAIHAED